MKTEYITKPKPCFDPEHNFPSMISLEDGIYTHKCPSCGNSQTVTIRNPTLKY